MATKGLKGHTHVIGERDTIRGVQIRAGAVYVYDNWRASEASETLSGVYLSWCGTYVIIVAHGVHT